MRILKIDERENFLHLMPEIEDDLWHLERIIEKHDLVSGPTDRKIKPRDEGGKAQRIKIFVTLDVELVEFHRFIGQLRVSGIIVEGKPAELLEIGSQQALEMRQQRREKHFLWQWMTNRQALAFCGNLN